MVDYSSDPTGPKLAEMGRTRRMSIVRLTTHTANKNLSPADRRLRILNRRGVFVWLPVLCSNDVVHGSWWFVWGSLIATIFPILVLLNPYIHIYESDEHSLPAIGYFVTWIMCVISGAFFTLGSCFFVRAFEEPPVPALFRNGSRHFQTDELFAAWMFLFGTLPAVPYSLCWFIYDPHEVIYLGLLVASVVFVFCTYLFVLACYPSDKAHRQVIKPIARVCLGREHWLIKHIQNDWLAGTWFFLIATAISVLGAFLAFLAALVKMSYEELFVFGFSVLDFLVFLVGCAYFCAGSYPEDILKCYKRKKDATGTDDDEEDDFNDGPPVPGRGYDPRGDVETCETQNALHSYSV